MTLEILDLRKRFGDVQALDGVRLTVAPGQVFGFLGANGAGKTTTMRVVLGFLRADEGEVTWEGRDARSWPRRTWGYLPEERGLYPRMPVLEQLVFFASLYGVPRDVARRQALDWLARFRIGDYADRKARFAVEGQPAESAVHRHDPPRPGRPPHGRAVQRPGPGQCRAAQGRVPRDARPWQDDRVQHASTGHGRRAVRVGGDHRSRADRRVGSHPRCQALDRSPGRPGRHLHRRRCELAHVAAACDGHPAGEDYTELRVDAGTDPQVVLQAAVRHGGDVLRFEVADPSLEEVFVERVGAIDKEERTLAAAGAAGADR